MSTIVVHGTMTLAPAHHSSWWWNSWKAGGFLEAVARGMREHGQAPDLWQIAGRHVKDVAELQPKFSWLTGRAGQFGQHVGHFLWDGADMGISRSAAASNLVKYLNALRKLAPREPMRVIAHSHGCNVVKLASADRKLDPLVRFERAVFLACPHFHGADAESSYRLLPARFGAILNLYSERDTVQTTLADSVKGLPAARVADYMPQSSFRVDRYQAARARYLDVEIPTADTGVAAHSAMHSSVVGYLAGAWLAGADVDAILARVAGALPVAQGDHGA